MQAQQHPALELMTQSAWAARGRARPQALVQALAYPAIRPQVKAQARVRTQARQHAAPQPTIQAVQAARGGARTWLLDQARAQAQACLASQTHAHPVSQSVRQVIKPRWLAQIQPAQKKRKGAKNTGLHHIP